VYIIDDLLNLTRSQDGSFPLIELGFDIQSALAEALKPLEHHARRKGLQFIVHVDSNFPQFVRGDFQRFQQAIVHIVSNAIQFTAAGHIKVEATLVNRNDSYYLIEIKVDDTGFGIAEDHLDGIFQELEQIPSENSEMGKPTVVGSFSRDPTPLGKPTLGLGLATVARFVRLRSGLLRMKSMKGQGTTVSVLLPFPRSSEAFHPFQLPTPPVDSSLNSASQSGTPDCSVSKVSGSDYAYGFFDLPLQTTNTSQSLPIMPAPPQTSLKTKEANQRSMTVMIADDNTINLQILQRRLERMGHQVEMSSNGQQCYDLFVVRSADIQFILMDLDVGLYHFCGLHRSNF
jgi:CheY-like chemotaxis protein